MFAAKRKKQYEEAKPATTITKPGSDDVRSKPATTTTTPGSDDVRSKTSAPVIKVRTAEQHAVLNSLKTQEATEESIRAYNEQIISTRVEHMTKEGWAYYVIQSPELAHVLANPKKYSRASIIRKMQQHRNEVLTQRVFMDGVVSTYDIYSNANCEGRNLFKIQLDDAKLLFHMELKSLTNLLIKMTDKKPQAVMSRYEEIQSGTGIRCLKSHMSLIDMGQIKELRTVADIEKGVISDEVIKIFLKNKGKEYESKSKVVVINTGDIIGGLGFLYTLADHTEEDLANQWNHCSNFIATSLPGPTSTYLTRYMEKNKDNMEALSRLSIKMQHMNSIFAVFYTVHNSYKGMMFGLYYKHKCYTKDKHIDPITLLAAESVQIMVDSDLYHETNEKEGLVTPRSTVSFSLGDESKSGKNNKKSLLMNCTAPGVIGDKRTSKMRTYSTTNKLNKVIEELKNMRDNPNYYNCPSYARCYLTGMITIFQQYQTYLKSSSRNAASHLTKLDNTIKKFNKLFPFSPGHFRFDKFQKSLYGVLEMKAYDFTDINTAENRYDSDEPVTEEQVRKYFTEGRQELSSSKKCIDEFVRECTEARFHTRKELEQKATSGTAKDSAIASVLPSAPEKILVKGGASVLGGGASAIGPREMRLGSTDAEGIPDGHSRPYSLGGRKYDLEPAPTQAMETTL